MNPPLDDLADLPGADLVVAGLADIAAGQVTADACLVAMAAPHLERAGIAVGPVAETIPEPERTLYALLTADGSGRDPYGRYNSLKRRIVRFARALALRRRLADEREDRPE